MGYTTNFYGKFTFDKTLDKKMHQYLKSLAETRRMSRDVPSKYGVEGEFYIEGEGFRGQEKDKSIIDYNSPPKTQPSLWLQWEPTSDGKSLEWNGAEKFYAYVEWLKYIQEQILTSTKKNAHIFTKAYKLNGVVTWKGESSDDVGFILAYNGNILTVEGTRSKKSIANAKKLLDNPKEAPLFLKTKLHEIAAYVLKRVDP